MRDWLADLVTWLERGPVAIVTVLSTEGSAPREAGARMLVAAEATAGTIGGGALEYAAIADARELLSSADLRQRRIVEMPLGPALQQCCGGFVRVAIEAVTSADKAAIEEAAAARRGMLVRPATGDGPWRWLSDRRVIGSLPLPVAHTVRAMLAGSRAAAFATIESGDEIWLVEPVHARRTALYLYGAGHVAREVVSVLDGLAFKITWIDVARARFPDDIPSSVSVTVTDDPVAVARAARPGTLHAVMTFSHALDEAITAALLEQNSFGYLGLIGSETKRARFIQRFRRAGLAEVAIARLTCPIGLPGVPGKEPRAIAIALAAELLQTCAAHQDGVARDARLAGHTER